MKSRFSAILVIFAIFVLSLSACTSLAEDVTPPPNAQEAQVAEPEATKEPAKTSAPEASADGATLFSRNCAECHGEDGTGIGNAADLTNSERMSQFPDTMVAMLIERGNGNGMPAFGDKLNETEIASLVTYLRGIEANAPNAKPTDGGGTQATTAPESEAKSTGTITGTIINGTTDEDLPANLIVQLEAYDHDLMTGGFNLSFTLETPLEKDGTYLFENLDFPEGRAFITYIKKDGVTYNSQPDFVTAGNRTLDIPITYYETSTDPSELRVDRLHIFFEPPNIEKETAQVVEVFVISNPSLYAIIPETEGKAVIEFALPEGATNIQFDDSVFGERYTETADGFGDTSAVLPGMGLQEVVVFFELPYKKSFLSGNKLDFVQKISHPIDSAIVMSPQGLKITSDLLQESGEREAQGLIYNTYSSQPLPIGATFEMIVSGKVSATATGNDTNSQKNIIYGALALGLVLIGAGVWFYLRDRNEEDEETEDDEDDSVEYDSADKLMDAIIALDDAYRSGDISEEAYRKRRGALKEQLKELV